jgi:hypothetical protein
MMSRPVAAVTDRCLSAVRGELGDMRAVDYGGRRDEPGLWFVREAKGGDHGGRVFAVWREISQGRRELALTAAFPQIEPGRG